MVSEYSAIDWETEALISGFVIVLLLSVFCLAAAQKMEKIAQSKICQMDKIERRRNWLHLITIAARLCCIGDEYILSNIDGTFDKTLKPKDKPLIRKPTITLTTDNHVI